MRAGFFFLCWSHLRIAWRSRFLTNIFVLFSLFASFVVLNSSVLVARNFEALSRYWGSKVEMNVYLDPQAEGVRDLQEEIEASALVKSVSFVSKKQAFAELEAQMAAHAPEILKDPDLMDFIPESLHLELKRGQNPDGYLETVKAFAEMLKKKPQVEDVQYGQGWINQMSTVLGVFQRIGALFLGVLLAGALFMVAFVIRNSLAQRREEIEILELVGASKSFIRVPFLVEGGVLALGAGLLSLWATNELFASVKEILMQEDLFVFIAYRLNHFSVAGIFLFALFYLFVGLLVSYLCLRRMNSGFAAAEGLGS